MDNAHVRDEVRRIMGYWLQLGVTGFRMDAVPFLIERKGAGVEHTKDYELLHQMRDFLQWRRRDAILLAEANVPPDESMKYFGDQGDRLQMMLNFPVNQRLFYAFATGDLQPLTQALHDTWGRPHSAQWVHFLRSHDELDLGRLSEEERQKVFEAFGPEKRMQLYDRGIRRRLAPMLGGDVRRIKLAYSLQFTLRGTPVLRYGEEIGMGENLSLPGRQAIRTPMQWSFADNGGFSAAKELVRPVISGGEYGYEKVNVTAQRHDPNSLLAWFERMIRTLRESPEVGEGTCKHIDKPLPAGVFAHRADGPRGSMVFLHNLAETPATVDLGELSAEAHYPNDVFADGEYDPPGAFDSLELREYGFRWIRLYRNP